jgi:hypothetical protein
MEGTEQRRKALSSGEDMINKHIEPVYWECSWGVSLATFRVSGSKWYARIGKRQPPTQEQQQQHFKTYLEKETRAR